MSHEIFTGGRGLEYLNKLFSQDVMTVDAYPSKVIQQHHFLK